MEVAPLRYRYSVWDSFVVLLVIASVWLGLWALRNAPESMPLHYNAAGEPDRWGSPSPFLLIGLPLILLLSTYPILRGIDLYLLARTPEKYGLMTNISGGTAVLMGVLGLQPALDVLFEFRPGVSYVLGLVGLYYVYMGILFRITPSEKIHMNTSGLIADTPEARQALAQGMGIGFIIGGLLTIPLAFLPGEAALISILPLGLGPLIGIGIGMAKAPKPKRG